MVALCYSLQLAIITAPFDHKLQYGSSSFLTSIRASLKKKNDLFPFLHFFLVYPFSYPGEDSTLKYCLCLLPLIVSLPLLFLLSIFVILHQIAAFTLHLQQMIPRVGDHCCQSLLRLNKMIMMIF